jgi:TolA-binding protein
VHVERGAVSVTAPSRAEPIALQAGDRLRLGPSEVALEHGKSAASVRTPAPASPSAASVAAAEPTPAPAVARPAAELDWRELYRSRKYRAALARAKELGFDRLASELPAAALADLADTARLGGEPALAIRALGALGRRFPESNEAREATFLLGRVHALRGEVSLATQNFERYLSASGSKAYESEAMGRLLELYAKGPDRGRAENMARRYLQRAPDGAYRRLAHSLLGTTAPSAASAAMP